MQSVRFLLVGRVGRETHVHLAVHRHRCGKIRESPPSRSTEKSWAAFSTLGGGFLRVPVGGSTLAASPLLHLRPPTRACSKGRAAPSRVARACVTLEPPW